MMDLDSAIQHCEEVADEKEEDVILYHNCATYNQNQYEKGLAENTEKECRACADEHRQLAEWLKDYKRLLEQEPCEDTISRAYIEPILEELENICVNGDEHILDLLADIKNAPPVTPQQRMGRWILTMPRGAEGWCYKCSECNFWKYEKTINLSKFSFCPNCGAKMQEVKEK